jgi:hypothetical protein
MVCQASWAGSANGMAEPEDRIDELEEKIDEARRQAEDDGLLPGSQPKPSFADPDADGDVEPPNVVGV